MKDELEKAQWRAMRYWYSDGIPELTFGGICLLLGLYFYFETALAKDSILFKILDMSFVLIVIAGAFLINRLASLFKQLVTYPRTGYVRYRQATGNARIFKMVFVGGLSMLIAAILGILFTQTPASINWMPAATGVIFSAVMLFIALRFNLIRYFILCAFSLLVGFILSYSGTGDIFGLAIYYLAMALILFAMGGLTMLSYFRQTNPGDENLSEGDSR